MKKIFLIATAIVLIIASIAIGRELKQSATTNVMVLMVNATDKSTGETGLSPTITISKGTGAFVSPSDGAVTERGSGYYAIALDGTDTSTLGDLVVNATASGADPVGRMFDVVVNFEVDTYSKVDTEIGTALTNIAGVQSYLDTYLDVVVSTRLAGTGVVGIHPSSVSVVNGTITEGDIDDVDDNNQTYLTVQETGGTGKFDIFFSFTSLTQTYDKVHFLGKYHGNPSHVVEIWLWNYTLSQWDKINSVTSRIQSTSEDQFLEFTIDGTVADYFNGTNPNITAEVKIYHSSNAVASHYLYIDMIGFGDMEIIYESPDNIGIEVIQEAVIDSTYGLAALQAEHVTAQVDLDNPSQYKATLSIKKNTALDNFTFLMVDSNGTPTTGLTVTAQRSIDGAAFGACANSVSEIGTGIYKINLSANDLNGDVITLKFTSAGARQRTYTVITAP